MQANRAECVDFTLGHEGLFDANPKDRGNWTTGVIGHGELKGTKFGIASHVYPNLDIKNLTRNEAVAIYLRDYWPKVAGDVQPDGVDLVAWDICVNSGASRALSMLAKALGVPVNKAANLAAQARAAKDKVELVKAMCAIRAAFYRSLSSFKTFGKGWLRRNAAAEAKGVTMALRATKAAPADIKKRLETEAKSASASVKKNGAGVATGTVAAGERGTDVADTAIAIDWSVGGKVAVVVILIVVTVYFVRKVIQHRERQKAYALAATAMIDPDRLSTF